MRIDGLGLKRFGNHRHGKKKQKRKRGGRRIKGVSTGGFDPVYSLPVYYMYKLNHISTTL